jgi:hypothetical protein
MSVTQLCDADRPKHPPVVMNLHLDVIAEGVETADESSIAE